jgi:hypothetical protein
VSRNQDKLDQRILLYSRLLVPGQLSKALPSNTGRPPPDPTVFFNTKFRALSLRVSNDTIQLWELLFERRKLAALTEIEDVEEL